MRNNSPDSWDITITRAMHRHNAMTVAVLSQQSIVTIRTVEGLLANRTVVNAKADDPRIAAAPRSYRMNLRPIF